MRVKCKGCGVKNRVDASALNKRKIHPLDYMCSGCVGALRRLRRGYKCDITHQNKLNFFSEVYRMMKQKKKDDETKD